MDESGLACLAPFPHHSPPPAPLLMMPAAVQPAGERLQPAAAVQGGGAPAGAAGHPQPARHRCALLGGVQWRAVAAVQASGESRAFRHAPVVSHAFCSTAHPPLLASQPSRLAGASPVQDMPLEAYSLALQRVAVAKMVRQLSEVYSVMRVSHMSELAPFIGFGQVGGGGGRGIRGSSVGAVVAVGWARLGEGAGKHLSCPACH